MFIAFHGCRRRRPINPSSLGRPIVALVFTYMNVHIKIMYKIIQLKFNNINAYLYNGRFTYTQNTRIRITIIIEGKVSVGLCWRCGGGSDNISCLSLYPYTQTVSFCRVQTILNPVLNLFSFDYKYTSTCTTLIKIVFKYADQNTV